MKLLLQWLYPGLNIKRWMLLFSFGLMLLAFGAALVMNYQVFGRIEEEILRLLFVLTGTYSYTFLAAAGIFFVFIGLFFMLWAIRRLVKRFFSLVAPDQESVSRHIVSKWELSRGLKVVAIGGGHGLSMLLRGLKTKTSNISAIVTVADDGGSSGRLREELGIIPPGDLRNCLVALADTEPLMEKLFQHRFEGASNLAGHSFGNLFLAAMAEVTGDMETALRESSKVLAVKGRVLPASKESVRLDAILEDGTVVEGESRIPEVPGRIRRVRLFPQDVAPVPSALEALRTADAIILGPGSLYTSIMPNLLVRGVADELRKSHALKIYICNVMTQPGETDGYTASMHAEAILKHAGRGTIDFMLVNNTPISEALRAQYAAQGIYPVAVDEEAINALGIGFVAADIISQADAVRHDPDKLSRNIMRMIYDFRVT